MREHVAATKRVLAVARHLNAKACPRHRAHAAAAAGGAAGDPNPASAPQRRAGGLGPPQIDVYLDVSSVESYLSMHAIAGALRGCHVRWRCSLAVSKMSVAVGMLRERGAVDPVRRASQLATHRTYAALRGIPLEVPEEVVDVSALEEAVAFAARREEPQVVDRLIELCLRFVFDPAQRGSGSAGQLLCQAGGDAAAFAAWPRQSRREALEEDKLAADAAGVWTTPFMVDKETGEAFIGESTLELLTLQLRRRGHLVATPAPPLPPPLEARRREPPAAALEAARPRLEVYVDLKSPYAFLAIEPTYALEEDFHVELVWLPFQLDIASFLGSAEVGTHDNKVKEGSDRRSPRQWRAVKYAYANVRRHAAERRPPLVVYGTRKIWNTRLTGAAMLFAARAGRLRDLQRLLWPPFWRRELDAERLEDVSAVLTAAGVEASGFAAFASGEGAQKLDDIQHAAKARGVFGVPTYVLDGEVLFGREHLPLLRRRLFDQGCARRPGTEVLESPYLWTRNELFEGV